MPSTRSNRTAIFAATAAVGLIIGGCSAPDNTPAPGASASKPAEINVFVIPSPSAEALKKIAPDWTAKTGIKVNFTEVEYGTAHQKALLSIQSKQGAYDVVQFDNTFLAKYGDSGALKPLADYVQNSAEYDINDFSPALQKYGDFRGQQLGLVFSTEPFILWYRKSLLDKANLATPTTWDEYENVAKTINSPDVAGHVMGYGPGSSWWWMQQVWSAGGVLYDDQFNPKVNTPEAIQATQFFKDLVQYAPKGALALTGDDVTIQFGSRDIAQMIQYSGYASLLYDEKNSPFAKDIETAAVPKGAVNAVELAGWNIGIPSDAPNPDYGWQFLEFALGKANAVKWLDLGAAAIGRQSITTNLDLLEKYPYLKLLSLDEPGLQVFPYPQLVTWPEFDKACTDALADIVSGKVAVEDGLNALQDKLTQILAKEPKG